jgi:Cell Wall Hydrolase
VSADKEIDALTRTTAAARVGAMSAQTSHDDASVMIGSAERALADLRSGLEHRLINTAPPRQLARPAVVHDVSRIKNSLRWFGVFTAGICAAGLAAIFLWPTGNGAASIGAQSTLTEHASIDVVPDDISTLPRPSNTDAVSRMYAAEFARSDTASVRCLAEAVYYEARGEPYIGQVAVAQVVLNRARSGKWHRNICAVISQGIERGEKCQFSYMCRTVRAAPAGPMWERAQEVAIDAVRGRVWLRELVEATHYHTTAVAPIWRQGLDGLGTFGSHIFYRTPELGYVLNVARATEAPAKPATVPTPTEKAAPDQASTDKPNDERSYEATSATVTSQREFKLPEAAPHPAPAAAAPKPRAVVRHARTSSDTEPSSPPSKADNSWVRELQNR